MRAIVLASTALVLSMPAMAAPTVKLGGSITVTEGQSVPMPIIKSGSGRAKFGIRTVPDTATEADFAPVNKVLSPYGSTAETVPTRDDQIIEGAERLKVQLYPVAGSKTIVDQTPQYVTILDNDVPPPPEPTPTPVHEHPPTTDVPTPSLSGVPSIPSNFDRSPLVMAYPPAGTAAPDVLGAFRFVCSAGQILYDDPVVYPGQPGKSHLHQFFGNTAADAHSTYESLRTTGDSTCMSPLNRSAYWMPAMLDDQNVYRPKILIYYKRRPVSDPKCDPTKDPQALGICVPLPNGLRYIFGFDMITGKPPTGAPVWYCSKTSGEMVPSPTGQMKYSSFDVVMQYCQVGQQLLAQVASPPCWDGKRLDSANHRDHMSFASYGSWGYLKCPPTHPYVVAGFTMTPFWIIDQPMKDAAAAGRLRVSSDDVVLGAKPGETLHADWWGAWDFETQATWEQSPQGCINGLKSCVVGDLGNGTRMTDPAAVKFPAQPMRVPIPALP